MNRGQRAVIFLGLVIILIMGLVPPWRSEVQYGGVRVSQSVGYHSLFRGAPKDQRANDPPQALAQFHIDGARLLTQFAAVGAATAILVMVLSLGSRIRQAVRLLVLLLVSVIRGLMFLPKAIARLLIHPGQTAKLLTQLVSSLKSLHDPSFAKRCSEEAVSGLARLLELPAKALWDWWVVDCSEQTAQPREMFHSWGDLFAQNLSGDLDSVLRESFDPASPQNVPGRDRLTCIGLVDLDEPYLVILPPEFLAPPEFRKGVAAIWLSGPGSNPKRIIKMSEEYRCPLDSASFYCGWKAGKPRDCA